MKKRTALRHQKRLPQHVISIGNITFGGTGKTPATMAVAVESKARGFLPCILTRGYKGRRKKTCVLSTGKGPLLDAGDAGDEAFLMAQKLQGIPIVKGSNRYEAGLLALESDEITPKPDLFILDDGFQHWRLERDTDIVLVDSTNPFGRRSLPPFGRLREPLSELKRADIIVFTRSDETGRENLEDLRKEMEQYNEKASVFFARHRPAGIQRTGGEIFPVSWLQGKTVYAFCGIGNPQSFKNTLLSLQAMVAGFQSFRDHHTFDKGDMEDIISRANRSGADWIVTTEKDIMRLSGLQVPENLLSLMIEFVIDKAFYKEIFTM